ncbi:MAG: arylsulfotransferase family protein [Bacteroidota bacterium]|nr:arylsulfotransferase family protein [Bacteroidota bacterium]MDP4230591.1 arylsulfotransferase family protein [Bacteroidota bacterium]MDP4236247.1 arylsulfotransferase family protein [Bacteroidota bacterium]
MRYRYVLLLLSIFLSSARAQVSIPGSVRDLIVYQSPENGETCVPAQTTLIVRPNASTLRAHGSHDFLFTARGTSSGLHEGSVVISDDHETVIFKPYKPFDLGEKVDVELQISGEVAALPFTYTFSIASMSRNEQTYWLAILRENEEEENRNSTDRSLQDNLSDTAGFPAITIDTLASEKVAPGDIFMAPNGFGAGFITAVDNTGYPNFERRILPLGCENFRPWPNNRVSYFRIDQVGSDGTAVGQIILLDESYNLIDSFQCGNGYIANDHEFQLLPNGHALLIAYDVRDTDMRIVTGDSNAVAHAKVIGGVIQELDLQKNVIFQWRTWDHFKITDATHIPSLKTVIMLDYAHLNSVDLDTDGNILASFRSMDEITKINRTNGKIVWRMGGKNNYFTFLGDTMQFSHQHDVRRISKLRITMMDNGNYHTSIWGNGTLHDTSYSRAVEYRIDEGSLTAKLVWQYRDIPYASAAGNVQRLANGNTFIGLGVSNRPNAIEVTPSGEKVFQLSLPLGTYNYRTFRFEELEPILAVPSGDDNTPESLSIHPNPAGDEVNISYLSQGSGQMHIELADVLGHVVRSAVSTAEEAGKLSQTFDIRGLPAGTYYCRLRQHGALIARKLVVHR